MRERKIKISFSVYLVEEEEEKKNQQRNILSKMIKEKYTQKQRINESLKWNATEWTKRWNVSKPRIEKKRY